MNIAILGTGNVGTGLTRVLANTKHGIVVANRDVTKAKALAQTLKAEGKASVQAADIADAVALADVVILAVPYGAVADLAETIEFDGKIIVDATNPVKDDFSGLSIGHSTSAAEEIQTLLPKAKVVKAFNTVFAEIYAEGLTFGTQNVPAFLASDDEAAKEIVTSIATDAGFNAVDSGPLSNARYIEPLAYLNIQFGYMLGGGTQATPAWLSR